MCPVTFEPPVTASSFTRPRVLAQQPVEVRLVEPAERVAADVQHARRVARHGRSLLWCSSCDTSTTSSGCSDSRAASLLIASVVFLPKMTTCSRSFAPTKPRDDAARILVGLRATRLLKPAPRCTDEYQCMKSFTVSSTSRSTGVLAALSRLV